MARLVGAKCPNCGAAVRVDPNLEWVTCDYCRTSSYVETPARKQAANHPPAHIPVIRVQAAARATLVIVLVAVLAPVILGGLISSMVFWRARTTIESVTPPGAGKPPRPGIPSPPVAPPAPKVSYFANATSVPGAFQASIGSPLKVKEVVVYDQYVIIEAQDPQKPQNVDRYTLRDGRVSDKDAVRLVGDEKGNLDKFLFDIGSINYALIPTLITDAKARLAIADAKASHVMVDRRFSASKQPGWRVYIGSDRESGYVAYDLSGKMVRVSK
ncbi:MAG: hypothetical protein WKG00_32840 [Polyangiaceae bacterium]